MQKVRLWTRNFIALVAANGLLFGSFHFLLPTLPLYAAGLGADGTQIGIIGGVFGFSAIFIRLFTDTGVRALGKKNCLYGGLALSILATLSYFVFSSIDEIIFARVLHGLGFGLSTTFAAAIAAEVIPAERRGEGIGYLGLGSTVAMAMAPALGIVLLTDFNPAVLFLTSAILSLGAVVAVRCCGFSEKAVELPQPAIHASIRNRFFESWTGIPAVLTILFGAAYGSVNTFIAMAAQEAGIPSAGLFFVVGTFFIFLSRPFGGRLLDQKGAFSVILPGGASYLLGVCLILRADSLSIFLLASVFYGLGAGLLLPALMTWMLNAVRAERRSAASATFYNMLDVGTSSGIMILGSVAGNMGYLTLYKYVAILMGLFLLFAVAQHIFHPTAQTKDVKEN